MEKRRLDTDKIFGWLLLGISIGHFLSGIQEIPVEIFLLLLEMIGCLL